MEREALASRVIEISPALQTFRSPVLLEIPHFASSAGAERETVVLRSNDGETWTLHVSDTVNDGEIYQVSADISLIVWTKGYRDYQSLGLFLLSPPY